MSLIVLPFIQVSQYRVELNLGIGLLMLFVVVVISFTFMIVVKAIKTLFVFSLVAFPAATHAATDGGSGASSVGTAEISLAIPELIKISNLEDIDFGTYSGSGDLAYQGSFTIAGNDADASATYRITGLGTGSGATFKLSNGSQELPYSVVFEDASGSVELMSSQTVAGRTGIHSRLGTTSRNARYSVRLAENTLRSASTGNYAGSLTLMVEPE